jgi:hypothetical protein
MRGAQMNLRQIKPRRPAVFVPIIGAECLVAVGLLYFALVKRGNVQTVCVIAFTIFVEGIYKTLKKWRLLRYGEEVRRRMDEVVTNPTIDPRLKGG